MDGGDSPQALPVGFALADLKVLGLVGAGTFGYVYRCAGVDGVVVAVREYLPRVAARGSDGAVHPLSAAASTFDAGLDRFVERAEGMARIRHPNVVRVIDVFRANGTAYASMDLATGEPVARLLRDDGTLPTDIVARYFGPVVDGLAAMHAAGAVHGNIGLGSILIGEEGAPVLLGLAVPPSDEFGAVAKPGYAPIEHYSTGAHFGGTTADVYALGAVLYRCMTGVVPPEPPVRVERDTLVPAVRAARGRYPPELLRAVDAALAVQPDDRPTTIAPLREAIALGVGAEPLSSPASASVGARRLARAGRSARKVPRPLAIGVGAAIMVAVAGLLVWRGTAPGTPVDARAPDEPRSHPAAQEAELAVGDEAAARPTATVDASESRSPAGHPPARAKTPDEPPPVARASLAVATVPHGATVVLDGVVVGETPLEVADLLPGTVDLALRHAHYETMVLDDTALVAGETTRLRRELVRATGSLRVTTVPAAWVALAGRRLADATPALLDDLPAGPLTITLGADDHGAADVDVVIPPGGVAELEHTLSRVVGTLTLALVPLDAEVALLNADAAYVPGVRLPVGLHRIRVARDGFETLERIVDVAGDAEVRIELRPQTYPFTVVTRPPGAAIRLADPDLAYVPGVPLRPGPYDVAATLRGYEPWNGTVDHGAAPTMYAVALEFASEVYADPMGSGGTGPEMVIVPAGGFRMGCGRATGCAPTELPVRTVAFEMPFSISKNEVTFDEFDRFASATGLVPPDAAGWGRGRMPAINVSWDDATAYTSWLSTETGRDYALPSEAEWEYAARAGTDTAFAWGDAVGESANCTDCGPGWSRTTPVGSFRPNGWGLHDMHGNVWEWVRDCWNDSYADAPTDGGPWLAGDCGRRVLRGGSWFNSGAFVRSATRVSGDAAVRGNIAGFRVTARDR